MAYLNFDPIAGTAPAWSHAPVAKEEGFSPLEWTVIALAKRDRIASLSEPSRMARALGGLFGRGTDSRLADPRLEALRRFAVHAWHRGYVLPVSEIKRFVSAGFSTDQAETLLGSVVDHHISAGERVPA
jgi:hypothetical protein